MDPLDDLLKSVDHTKRAPVPEGFEASVLHKWFDAQPKKKNAYSVWMFAAAACLAACTCMNILSLTEFKNSAASVDTSVSTTSLEDEFADEYGLQDNMSYYSLNE